jgi:polar amino acid transport system substrate-binding protein
MTNKFGRRRFVASSGVLGASLFATRTAHAETTLEKIKRTGQLTVATEAALPPFEFVKDGKIVGYGSDILVEVVKALGVQVKQLDLPFQGLMPGLLAGKFDFVATTVNVNEERTKRYAFTLPIAPANSYVLKRKGDPLKSAQDLNGKVVGTQLASGPEVVARNFDKKLKAAGGAGYKDLKLFTTFGESWVALANRELDAAIAGFGTLALLVKDKPDVFELAGLVPSDNPYSYNCWLTRAEDTSLRDFLNDVFRKMRTDGRLTALQEKWFGFKMDLPDKDYLPPGSI